MDRDALGDRIAELAAQITAVTYTLLVAIREFDEAGGWFHQGAVSCAQWLSWRIGMSPGMAREKVRVARALASLPLISKRFEEGRLSYSKVRPLVRVATSANEADLVNVAMSCTASDLERICRRFRSVLEQERSAVEGPEDAEARRYVRHRYTDDGMVRVTIQVPAEEGARLLAAIESGALASSGGDDSAETPKRMNRADGLMALAESFLSDGARPRRGGAPHEVQLHVSKTELEEKSEGAFVANAGDLNVSAETARRLSCDAGVVELAEDDRGKVLDVGRRTRTVPSAMRRALNRRHENKCAFPGCTNQLFLDAHHIEHWVDGGRTSLDNLILLCRRHHTFVHEHGYSVTLSEDGSACFTPPAGSALPRAPVPRPCPSDIVERIAERHAERGLSLNEVCLIPPDYDGDPIDYDEAVAELCWASRPDKMPSSTSTGTQRRQSTATASSA